MKLSILSSILLFFAFLSFEGCYYDNEEDLYPVDPSLICDTVDVSFQTEVKAILEKNECVSCHMGNFPSGNVSLDTYQGVAAVANSGLLLGVISHQDGFKVMPPSGIKIDDCEIKKIKSWIDDGARER